MNLCVLQLISFWTMTKSEALQLRTREELRTNQVSWLCSFSLMILDGRKIAAKKHTSKLFYHFPAWENEDIDKKCFWISRSKAKDKKGELLPAMLNQRDLQYVFVSSYGCESSSNVYSLHQGEWKNCWFLHWSNKLGRWNSSCFVEDEFPKKLAWLRDLS